MSEFEPPPPASLSKAARNEGRKLFATAFNNLGVALLLAALVQPVVFYLQQRTPLDLATVAASTMFVAAGVGCLLIAQAIARRIED